MTILDPSVRIDVEALITHLKANTLALQKDGVEVGEQYFDLTPDADGLGANLKYRLNVDQLNSQATTDDIEAALVVGLTENSIAIRAAFERVRLINSASVSATVDYTITKAEPSG